MLTLLLLWVQPGKTQPGELRPETARLRTFILGERTSTWRDGGGGIEPLTLPAGFARTHLDTGNVPAGDIEFDHKPGWMTPRFFDGETNIASLVLEEAGSVRAPNSSTTNFTLLRNQLRGMVNGDHDVAYERKPTVFNPVVPAFGIWLQLDFGLPVGVQRIRFYPRNTVVATPKKPFHNDFLRGYEVWVNERLTSRVAGAPDVLVTRVPENVEPVVDVAVNPQYVRLIKLRSLTQAQFEIDEIEVFGTGYMQQGVYYSDLIDLGSRATVGSVRWLTNTVGEPEFSKLAVRVRTGTDDTPILFRKRVIGGSQFETVEEIVEVTPEEYFELIASEKFPLDDDDIHWSQWLAAENGAPFTAPAPRRYIQFRFQFAGRLFETREVDRLFFQYLQPPVADVLRAEVFPRLAEPEKAATFRYAVRLRATGPVVGYDELEVDTIVPVTDIRGVRLNGEPLDFRVVFSRADAFRLAFPKIDTDDALLEFTFDLPVFRFGTTFSGRAFNSRFPTVPQRLEPGQATVFGPDDVDELSGLAVAIPKPRIGRLVGEIALTTRVLTPNGDGVNDELTVQFNLLQLVRSAPVALDIYDLSGRKVHRVALEERGLGPASFTWDGRSGSSPVPPGNYIWVLRVMSDAFEERHMGVIAVAY